MSTKSLTWLSALLAVSNTVSAIPVEQKRAANDWVTATIDGQVVSWTNNYPGAPTSAGAAVAAGSDWVTATIDGQIVSWVNNWPGSAAATPAPTSAPAAASAMTTAAPVPAATEAPATVGNTDPSCKDVHIFLAKGWNEPYPGRQGKLAGAICYGLDSCDYEDIQYENAEGSDYCTAVAEGDRNGVAQMTAYAERCPASKLVLSGYSQGANIVGDILGGGDRADCNTGVTNGLDRSSSPGSKRKFFYHINRLHTLTSITVGAVLLFGDPEHVANQAYNVLSGSGESAEGPRNGDSLTRMNQFSSVTRSYCDHADPICAAAGPGPFDVNTHLNYFDIYSDDAAGWVKSTLGY